MLSIFLLTNQVSLKYNSIVTIPSLKDHFVIIPYCLLLSWFARSSSLKVIDVSHVLTTAFILLATKENVIAVFVISAVDALVALSHPPWKGTVALGASAWRIG